MSALVRQGVTWAGKPFGAAVAEAFLAAASHLEAGYDAALDQHHREVKQARYTALKAD
ncbi:MAG: hypothetical protein JWN52_2747 [Actinomycetia bacterium]|nr:hypothetical protein [Actinomycetes bacterium]